MSDELSLSVLAGGAGAGLEAEIVALEAAHRESGWPPSCVRDELASGMAWVVVAGADPVLGWISGRFVADEAELVRVAVDPRSSRCGIGRRLVEALLREARRLGCAHVHLEVAARNLAARALYVSLGFEEIGMRRGYYRAPPDDAILMMAALRTGTANSHNAAGV